MSVPRDSDILFRFGASTLARTGVVWRRGRMDGTEPDKYTFTRASTGVGVDRLGVGRVFAADQLRTEWVDLDGDGARESLGFRLEGARTQLVTDPENFGAWTLAGSLIRTGGQSDPFGGTAAWLLDAVASSGDNVHQTVGFTGDATKSPALLMRAGTSTQSKIGIFDETVPAHRHQVNVNWSGGLPSLATNAGAGALFTVEPWGGGWYRIAFNATGVIAANSNGFYIWPDETGAGGTVYVFGANAWNAPVPSSYQGPSGGATVRAADSLTFPIPWGPQDLTVYAKLARPAWADASGALGIDLYICNIGGDSGRLSLLGDGASRTYRVFGDHVGGSPALAATSAILAGATQSICAQMDNSAATGLRLRLDVGGGFGSWSSVVAPLPVFGAQVARPGAYSATLPQLDGALIDLVVARGLRSLAEMAASL